MTHLELLQIAHRIDLTLLRISQMLDLSEESRKETCHMAVDPKVAALIAKFDAATNSIAARIQKLIDGGGLNAESEAALTAEVDKLTALGKDPEAPIPPDAA